ncbi:MAG: RcnB family protein [Arenimonas sp.]|jgi:Ni/Co efflux regulator RcnB
MKRTLLALTSALLLAGAAVSPASAQNPYLYADVYGDVDRDGVPNRFDLYDNRYGIRLADRDCDGMADRYDNIIRREVRDRDCDGVPNRFDRYNDRRYSAPRYIPPSGYNYARWSVGGYLPAGYYSSAYYIDYRPYGLAPPPYGYRWVRVGDDVYLASTRDGLIAEVVFNLFR